MTQRRSAALAVAFSLATCAAFPAIALADNNSSISLTITDSDSGMSSTATNADAGASSAAMNADSGASSTAAPSDSVKHFHRKSRRSSSTSHSSAASRSRYSSVSRGMTSQAIGPSQVMGRLGTVITDSAVIRGGRERYGRVLSTVQKGQSLAINGETDTQYAVLMIDRTLGFINKSDVQLLNYQVVSNDPASPAAATGLGAQMVETAKTYLNVPYLWGGNTRDGIDCSGFVKAVYSQYGIDLPRHSGDQANVGYDVPKDDFSQWRPGDRLYFACHHAEIDHTAMYMGNGYFIHASAGHGRQVWVDRVDNAYYYAHLVCVRRSKELLGDPVGTPQQDLTASASPSAPTGPTITTVRGTKTTQQAVASSDGASDQTAAPSNGDAESSQQ